MTTWTRTADGTYTLDGWTIRRAHSKGNGQDKPFQHVTVKASDYWEVSDPQGFRRCTGITLKNAKSNGARMIARAEANS